MQPGVMYGFERSPRQCAGCGAPTPMGGGCRRCELAAVGNVARQQSSQTMGTKIALRTGVERNRQLIGLLAAGGIAAVLLWSMSDS